MLTQSQGISFSVPKPYTSRTTPKNMTLRSYELTLKEQFRRKEGEKTKDFEYIFT
ncbi:hypothetical protein HKBW3S09_01020 [Candidatus Hakubella thermalkaliphila]|uniref:Uncharacterized protein n=1 Tax=Candidatus Hakubella thermalkaliphila TaxID=2754717 RepID=A0A6V8PDZ5_9ACTN|nr:hypothetical protein HKBW3S09_01020 [Candidatus Hakubella thermalkaliphila]GFP30573.1 hypothetical protein HKBW3S34_01493 [Candidatus Hakubella thermalkaliphila]GFP39415.1 hypothetical protein HKBW3S47_01114 [Candidatus Hakubella thermalkaliphila]GFP41285.1 hypothetical protein HKBW3C_00411 [Candidatus Hakubella thermalkaliphila]